MKILRSKGNSFTERDDEKLGRGLALKSQTPLTPDEYRTSNQNAVVRPAALARYVGEDYALILRQTISVLDKIIRKPRRLSEFELHAYIDRTLLSEELWKLLTAAFGEKIKTLPDGDTAYAAFETTWRSKIHPYARDPYDPVSPQRDRNANFLQEKQQIGRTRAEFQGRWHRVFWVEQDGSLDYGAIAQGIWQHLFEQERTLAEPDEKEQKHYVVRKEHPSGRPTGKGLIEARGVSMRKSTNDPRIGKKEEKTRHWTDTDIGADIEDIYFSNDIATRIHHDALENVSCNELISRSFFGSRLHEHFGPILKAYYEDDERKTLLWALHNAVREFYQKVAKSERFRRCCTIAAFERKQCNQTPCDHLDRTKLVHLLPENHVQLLDVLNARRRNTDFSELIRLGKVIAHASELPLDTDPAELNPLYKERLEFFVTSAGQSVIKQNETFTRIWRTSTGLALRTLQAWTDPDQNAQANKKIATWRRRMSPSRLS